MAKTCRRSLRVMTLIICVKVKVIGMGSLIRYIYQRYSQIFLILNTDVLNISCSYQSKILFIKELIKHMYTRAKIIY